jgi:predicted metal-binding protein
LRQAGFEEGELVTETGFNSSPVTKGALFRAVKPLAVTVGERAEVEDQMETVVVAEWVRWKCHYGCPLFEKDPFHPPVAPDAESTKKVLREYTKAILLNGPNGQTLTEAAVRLEGEAYHRGFYKAFALTALVPGGASACAPPGPAPVPCCPPGST